MDEKMTPSDPEPNTKRPKRARPKSRLQRWAEAVKKANDALKALADLREALEDFQSLKEEYADWRASLLPLRGCGRVGGAFRPG